MLQGVRAAFCRESCRFLQGGLQQLPGVDSLQNLQGVRYSRSDSLQNFPPVELCRESTHVGI